MTVIPDSIEPYIGYKALNMGANDGWLSSPQQAVVWPPGKRLEASCTRGLSQWSWVPVEGEPRSTDDTTVVSSSSGVMYATSAATTSMITSVRPVQPPRKPNNPLPPGWNWSWEPLTHDVPAEDCSCGIYVVDHPEGCQGYISSRSVLVEVALWGTVIIGERGARGQYAYPQRLIASKRHAVYFRPSSELYGIPVIIAESWCPAEWV